MGVGVWIWILVCVSRGESHKPRHCQLPLTKGTAALQFQGQSVGGTPTLRKGCLEAAKDGIVLVTIAARYRCHQVPLSFSESVHQGPKPDLTKLCFFSGHRVALSPIGAIASSKRQKDYRGHDPVAFGTWLAVKARVKTRTPQQDVLHAVCSSSRAWVHLSSISDGLQSVRSVLPGASWAQVFIVPRPSLPFLPSVPLPCTLGMYHALERMEPGWKVCPAGCHCISTYGHQWNREMPSSIGGFTLGKGELTLPQWLMRELAGHGTDAIMA